VHGFREHPSAFVRDARPRTAFDRDRHRYLFRDLEVDRTRPGSRQQALQLAKEGDVTERLLAHHVIVPQVGDLPMRDPGAMDVRLC
jgi:hypothetical protein